MMFWRRLPFLLPWRRRAAERDMQEELRSIAEMARPGELGNLAIAAEDARAQWGWTRLEQLAQDLRYGVRGLRRNPAFTTAAVFSLAIGIGANTALFTLINTLLWKLLPVQNPEQLLVLGQQSATSVDNGFTYQHYELFRDANPALDFAAYAPVRLNVSIEGSTEPTTGGQLVTGGYFPLLGVRAALGRLLGPEDDRVPMGHPVVVLSHEYWRRRFNADPGAVGRQILLSGSPFTIVGVAPPDFFGVDVGSAPLLFAPVMMQPVVMPMTVNLLERPNVYSTWLRIVARLAPGASLTEAAGRLDALASSPETDWRPRNKFTGRREDVRLVLGSAATGLSDLRRQFSQPLWILLAVAGVVLLVACANVANLLLARAAGRRSEFTLRLALGASRGRLMRQVLVEGLLLAGLAGAAGVALAFWATRALVIYASSGRSAIVLDLSPDLRVLAFATTASALAGMVFASVPAFRASRAHAAPRARDAAVVRGVGAVGGPGRALVVSQVALSLVLLIAAGLFARSLRNLTPDDGGVDRANVLLVPVEPRGSGDRNRPGAAERFDRVYRDLLVQMDRIPGVRMASLARTTPLSPSTLGYPIVPAAGEAPRMVVSTIVYPKYFATMGIAVVTGRDFDENDLQPGAPPAVIVNEAFARAFLDGRDRLGSTHGVRRAQPVLSGRTGQPRFNPGDTVNIVGVVQDSRFPALRAATPPIVYQTFLQANTGFAQMVLHVRTDGIADVVPSVRASVQAVDPLVPLAEIRSFDDEVAAALVRERLVATLSGVFAGVALVLVCVGLYGLLASSVARRKPEIGIRVALGATRSAVRWMIARQALGVVLAGLAIGLPAAWISARLLAVHLEGLLFQLKPTDPATTGAAALVLVLVAMCAGLLPAHRATRIDPAVALRSE